MSFWIASKVIPRPLFLLTAWNRNLVLSQRIPFILPSSYFRICQSESAALKNFLTISRHLVLRSALKAFLKCYYRFSPLLFYFIKLLVLLNHLVLDPFRINSYLCRYHALLCSLTDEYQNSVRLSASHTLRSMATM